MTLIEWLNSRYKMEKLSVEELLDLSLYAEFLARIIAMKTEDLDTEELNHWIHIYYRRRYKTLEVDDDGNLM